MSWKAILNKVKLKYIFNSLINLNDFLKLISFWKKCYIICTTKKKVCGVNISLICLDTTSVQFFVTCFKV